MTMPITIRDAEPRDLPAVLELMGELAEHEGLRQYLALTPESVSLVLGWEMDTERKRKLFWDNAVRLYARAPV